MKNEIDAVEWRTKDNSLQIKMQDGREVTADAYVFMQFLTNQYANWLFDPRVGTIVTPRGKVCYTHTPNGVKRLIGEKQYFLHLAEWLEQAEIKQVEETADDET